MTNHSSSTTTFPRNGLGLPSFRSSVFPHVVAVCSIDRSLLTIVNLDRHPYCTSDPFPPLVAFPQCDFLRIPRAYRLERSIVVQSIPLPRGPVHYTVSRLQRSQFVPLLKGVYRAVVLVIAPTPLVAANFILLGHIIQLLGPQYSRLTPRRCKLYESILSIALLNLEHRHHRLRFLCKYIFQLLLRCLFSRSPGCHRPRCPRRGR